MGYARKYDLLHAPAQDSTFDPLSGGENVPIPSVRRQDAASPARAANPRAAERTRLTPSAVIAAGPLKMEVAVDVGLVMVLVDLLWWIRR
jgi:hypothetical protein